MTRKGIDTSREIRLWIQTLIVVAPFAVWAGSMVKEKVEKSEAWEKFKFRKAARKFRVVK